MTEERSSFSAELLSSITARLDRPLVLVGLMGAGKSSVGRRLANIMGCNFVDADEEIENAAQRSISEIFEEFGEGYFRDGERRVIARLIEDESGVIATGGGAFVNDQTRALILAQTVAVWIDCEIDTLVDRTSRRDTRPLLKGGNPREILSRLYDERRPFYAQAPIHVMSDTGPQDATVAKILEALDKWL